jgi:hypothetical protein
MSSPQLADPALLHCDMPHANRKERRECPVHHARELAVERRRRADIRAGRRPPRMPSSADHPAPKCPDHPSHQAGCEPCKAYSRYDAAVRRRMRREGKLIPDVDVAIVQAHLKVLTDKKTGGWTFLTIAERTGIGRNDLYGMMRGRTKHVRGVSWLALRELKPLGVPAHVRKGSVPILESQRIVRGLVAQGWSLAYLAELRGLKSRDNTFTKVASGRRHDRNEAIQWVRFETRDMLRELAAKLGALDINRLSTPLPGMTERAAAYARSRSWVPLSAWAGQDLADPDATPFTGLHLVDDEEDDELGETDEFAGVDQVLAVVVRRLTEKLDKVSDRTHGRRMGRWRSGYIEALTELNRLEVHAVAMYASTLGMSEAEIAVMIGYGYGTDREIEAGQRQVCRILGSARRANAWIQSHPAGWVPWWFTFQPTGTKRELDRLLPPLLALQPAPFGPGWSVEQLAQRCGVTVQEMTDYLVRASETAGALWQRPIRRPAAARAA